MRLLTLALPILSLIALAGPAPAQPFMGRAQGTSFTPVYISFVPGISLPFGSWDVLVAAGTIGAAVHDVDGVMGSGVFNLSHNVRGIQGAGVFNVSAQVRGVQASGVFNISEDFVGLQAAGVFNIAKKVRGVQAAGVFNIAGEVSGLQVGIVNVAEEIDGFQLGLVNIARDGVNGLGLAYEPQSDYAWAYWQNGSRYLYTILSAGMPYSELGISPVGLMVSAGLGTRLGGRGGRPWVDLEILSAQEIGTEIFEWYNNGSSASCSGLGESWPELRMRLGIPLTRRLALVGGFVMDLDIGGRADMPAAIRTGWQATGEAFGTSFCAYTRYYLGLKF